MVACLVIAVEDNYLKGLNKFIDSWLDHCTKEFSIEIISRTINNTGVIRPKTPKGKTVIPWLTDSFTWFEALLLPYDLIIVADADQLVVGNIDTLWDMEPGIYAGPANNDPFCTGVVVFNRVPIGQRYLIYADMVSMIDSQSWHYGDQTLFNTYCQQKGIKINDLGRSWQHLKCYGMDGIEDAIIIHYHGQPKPWDCQPNESELIKIWHDYDTIIQA